MAKTLKEYLTIALCFEDFQGRIGPPDRGRINFAQVFGPPPARGYPGQWLGLKQAWLVVLVAICQSALVSS